MEYINYKYAKHCLQQAAERVKEQHPDDIPMQWQVINDNAYSLARELKPHQQELIHNYAAHLHHNKK
jgi:hypothetical protein